MGRVFDRLLEEMCESYPITTEGKVPRVRYIWPEDAFRPPLEVSERDGPLANGVCRFSAVDQFGEA
jgi:hypothetical protein